jgi:CheY-like chemotaxis protein
MAGEQTILVVEDDPDVRESIVDALESQGYRVLAAAHGLEAIHLLRGEDRRPDVILLDMLMPVMNGWTFRAEQRKAPGTAAIPVIVITAYGVPQDRVLKMGVAAFLRKPIELDVLLETIARVTQNPAALSTPPPQLA